TGLQPDLLGHDAVLFPFMQVGHDLAVDETSRQLAEHIVVFTENATHCTHSNSVGFLNDPDNPACACPGRRRPPPGDLPCDGPGTGRLRTAPAANRGACAGLHAAGVCTGAGHGPDYSLYAAPGSVPRTAGFHGCKPAPPAPTPAPWPRRSEEH